MTIEEIVAEFRNAYKTTPMKNRDIESRAESLWTNVPGLYAQAANTPKYIFAMVPDLTTLPFRFSIVKYELDK